MSDLQADPGPAQFEAGVGFVDAHMVQSSQDKITASTTQTQAGATKIVRQFNRITTVATDGDAVVLPIAFPGMNVCLVNAGAKNMQVYGASSDKINGIAGSSGVSQMPQSTVYYACTSLGVWSAPDLGCGTNGNYPTLAYQTALTASTTQSAAGGTAITSSIAQFDTVVNTSDAATLPAAQPGMSITVINNANHTMVVYALTEALGGVSGGDTINGSTSTTMAGPPVITIFYSTVKGKWITK